MKTDHIFKAFDKQPVKIINGNKYCVNTLTDHSPATDPALLKEIQGNIRQVNKKVKADFIIGEEDRGGYIAAMAAVSLSIPFSLVKWNPSGLEGEIKIKFRNTYATGNLYLNGANDLKGKRVLIVEDLIDSGGTVISMVKLIRKSGAKVAGIVAVANKVDYKGVERIKNAIGIKPITMISFKCGDNKTSVIK